MSLEELKRNYLLAVSKNKDREFLEAKNVIETAVKKGLKGINFIFKFETNITRLREEGFKISKVNNGNCFNIYGWAE